MTPKEMIEAQAAEFEMMSRSAKKACGMWAGRPNYESNVAYCAGKSDAYRDSAESLRRLLALKGWK